MHINLMVLFRIIKNLTLSLVNGILEGVIKTNSVFIGTLFGKYKMVINLHHQWLYGERKYTINILYNFRIQVYLSIGNCNYSKYI